MPRLLRISIVMGVIVMVGWGLYALTTLMTGKGDSKKLQADQTQQSTLQYVVAAVDIPFGVLMTDNMLELREDEPDKIPPGAQGRDEVINHFANTLIRAGQPILKEYIGEHVKDAFSRLIPPGKVAVALPINPDEASKSLYRTLKTYDRVKINAAYDIYAHTLVPDALVLAVGGKVNGTAIGVEEPPQQRPKEGAAREQPAQPSPPPPSIIVAVTPRQAQWLSLAIAGGASLSFALSPSQPPLPPSMPGPAPEEPTKVIGFEQVNPKVAKLIVARNKLPADIVSPPNTLPAPVLPPVDAIAQRAASGAVRMIQPKLFSLERGVEQVRSDVKDLRKTVPTQRDLKDMEARLDQRIDGLEKHVVGPNGGGEVPPEEETIKFFLGSKEVRVKVGQAVSSSTTDR